MAELIDVLPGLELPVEDVTKRLTTMWESGHSPDSPSEFRALQMNVVLHFGLDVTPEQAQERFDTVVRFAQRYPSRIIVLCPTPVEHSEMTAKLFTQCYIGETHREMCCCEALMLRYKSENFGYLANQVSVWLEADLPTYHWMSGVPSHRVERYFDNLLVGVRRIVFDSSVEPEDLYALDWPEPDRVHDMARARLLPVRQSIGQFLSAYPIQTLCDGLKEIRFRHNSDMRGEASRLVDWVKDCLCDCSACDRETCSALDSKFIVEPCTVDSDSSLIMEWVYEDKRFLTWRKFNDGSRGEIVANLGKGEERIPTRVKPLPSEQALAEALFF
ncbi:glucose-6-phosphate dehydrogenase assembly protein OpcA [Coraliomargarita akajimensis]|uniref:Glucose-6-phosphate dehydrogenase assembly protein OpcA N-terminal domain-containing protein n=1 Tax=Coraliomargarita akajimensis (strain DSM 45221 / IAM 15411 / JCM 23193 / KCTC 12865 / 04OKA010-24) TaxID=583355 RepID=D5EM58_CORAD|nr:glucose-6-phosphate dehydrogenase assembly protein OpcA [Coraliomargarita akajimensis]ADE55218.1 conserved hypothetical protein [Coraliomargarita akajimensis DSM 45221]